VHDRPRPDPDPSVERDVRVEHHVLGELAARPDDRVRSQATARAEPGARSDHDVRPDRDVAPQLAPGTQHRRGVHTRLRPRLRVQPGQDRHQSRVHVRRYDPGPIPAHPVPEVRRHEKQPRARRLNVGHVTGLGNEG
jgi:hypothetical protein